jgi:hypothetical protein
MKLSRRVFLSTLLLAKPARITLLKVEVLETFDLAGRSVAFLVHHADAASRQNFATWLQNNPNSTARIRTGAGFETQASVFRVRMCFGRALILPREPMQTRRGEALTLVASKV